MLGLACGLVLRLGLVSGLYKWYILSCNCEATQPRRKKRDALARVFLLAVLRAPACAHSVLNEIALPSDRCFR